MLDMASSKYKQTFTEGDRDLLRKEYLALTPFFNLDHPVLPAAYIKALLLVGIEEGLGVSEYAGRAGTTPTVMTRNLLDIGDLNRQRLPGLGLITQERDIMDLRRHRAKLTPAGARTLNDMLTALKTIR